jgi:hypothetical protein
MSCAPKFVFIYRWPLSVILCLFWSSLPFSDAFIQNKHQVSIARARFHNLSWQNQGRCAGQNDIVLHMAGSQATKNAVEEHWFPLHLISDAGFPDTEAEDASLEMYEDLSLKLMASLIRKRLQDVKNECHASLQASPETTNKAYEMARGKFVDLTCSLDGERVLEQLFINEVTFQENDKVVRGAVVALQSLLIFGMQLGVKGTPEQLQRSVAHLIETRDAMEADRDIEQWDASSSRRLKYRSDRVAGVQLLAELQWKRMPQGAFDLLLKIGAWRKHEDLPLLRSGFSLRFSHDEHTAAREVCAGVLVPPFEVFSMHPLSITPPT